MEREFLCEGSAMDSHGLLRSWRDRAVPGLRRLTALLAAVCWQMGLRLSPGWEGWRGSVDTVQKLSGWMIDNLLAGKNGNR